ncbi:hypothetical protein MNBD_NITROSPINAE01-790 [hydrothermal vent metagenome]|uniref:Phospholipase C/D domain-containing protein n=1 Tax=hydrothermal vent metagenome TaxID=652676 RepID=A0A3B1D2K3_9ZZZZ
MESPETVIRHDRVAMRNIKFLIAVLAGLFTLFAPDTAQAWGAGIHVAQGSFILDNLRLIAPNVAAVLATSPYDYIYGCISADIFIGKGHKRHDDHCHNWSVGFAVLEEATDNSTKAYAYGYLTHLAADIIAHNYFIPHLLYSTSATKRLGHIYWEFRADRFIAKKYWTLASKVVSMHNDQNDTLIRKVVKKSHRGFGAKKVVFKRALKMSDIINWRKHVEGAKNSRNKITRKDVSLMNNYSLNLIIDMLLKGEQSFCLRYDPVGTDNTNNSKLIRRSHIMRLKMRRTNRIFPTPPEIIDVKHIDHETERL